MDRQIPEKTSGLAAGLRNSKAGYIGGISLALLSLAPGHATPGGGTRPESLVLMLLVSFAFMLAAELLSLSSRKSGKLFGEPLAAVSPSSRLILKSAMLRYVTLISPWLIMNFFIQTHYYFQSEAFAFTRIIFSWITWGILIAGFPYIYITLKFRGHRKYEYNDYAILMMLWVKSMILNIRQKHGSHIYRNRRIKKVFLAWLVTFFFLPLMLMFFSIEVSAFQDSLRRAQSDWFEQASFYQRYHVVYLCLFHLIFIMDSGLGVIAYTVSSRWINNRVKSVDQTMSGWFVALLCYPPMNHGFTGQFIGYNNFPTQPVIHSEIVQMFVWAVILVLFSVYVWATAALGFKFSNLCNRGIIASGPYRYFRHPAYTCKNIAWWFDNSHVLSSIPASLALLAGNIIYMMRGITEERHLRQDPNYQRYCDQVKGRFFFHFPKASAE